MKGEEKLGILASNVHVQSEMSTDRVRGVNVTIEETPIGLNRTASVLPEEASIADGGELHIGGCPVTELVATYGTPAYVFDELGLRRQIRRFVDGLQSRWPSSEVLFASKSLPAVAMYSIARSEGLSVDVAGAGELSMALAAGINPERIYLHGNAKSDAELKLAVDAGIRAVMVDNFDDIRRLKSLVAKPQSVFIRMIPGISPTTHDSQVTGGSDSKFGLPADQIAAAVAEIRDDPYLQLDGVHLHIGSQILETEPFAGAVESVSHLGPFAAYDIGGGLGVTYTPDEPAPSVDEYLDSIVSAASRLLPEDAKLLIEPGRAIVARAGVTLYRVNTVKRTAKTFVAVDGGMADNLDIALTQQTYEAYSATKFDRQPDTTCDLVGRQCESGDLLRADVGLVDPQVDDIIIMPATGAYSYTMANHYNGALTPPIVFCRNGTSRLGARRETEEDVMRLQQPGLIEEW